MSLELPKYHIYSLVNAPKIQTDLLWDLGLLFIGLGGLYFLSIFFFRNKLSRRSGSMANRKKELAPLISNFLFFEEDSSREEKEEYLNLKIQVRDLLKDKFNRKALTEILMDLQKDLSGDAQQRIYTLYKDLGLDQDAFKKLKSWKWEVISEGILELTHLQVGEAFTIIRNFINHRRGVVRKQAQIATVTLKDEGINYFLDSNKYSISEWQQLKLLDVLRHKEDFEPPRFKAWLTSKNRDVVLFALRLIKYYKQNDAEASLIQLIKHKNNQIKAEAISCIKEFHYSDAVETLKAVFWRCSTDVKLSLLDAIGAMGSEKDIEFLQSIEKKETNFIVKSKTLSAINAISPESVMPSEGILETLDQPIDDHEEQEEPVAVQEVSKPQTEEPEEEAIEIKSEPQSPPINLEDIEVESTPITSEKVSEEVHIHNSPVEEIMGISQDNSEQPNIHESMTPKPSNPKDTNDKPKETKPEEEHLIDPETEDETIFEICFMEDLQDILEEADPDKEAAREILPLDFLPIVTETDDNPSAENIEETEASILKNMEVVAEIIREGNSWDEILTDEQPFASKEGASEEDFELDF
ncbi:MAG: HEAT repeat domain-containing protein, partial [Bacteroidota bacterium]